MSTITNILNSLRAEVLLNESYLLTQIEELRGGFQLSSDRTKLTLDDAFFELQMAVNQVERIELLPRVPRLQEGNYTVDLVNALDRVQDQITILQNRGITLQSRLVSAQSQIEELSGAFEAWYTIAVAEFIKTMELKLPASTTKSLARSEFNRLMGGVPVGVSTLLEAVKGELKRLETKKKMAQQKFDLGREQVNASWADRLPEISGHSGGRPNLLGPSAPLVEEEEFEGPVSYISKKQGATVTRVVAMPNPTLSIPIEKVIPVEIINEVAHETTEGQGLESARFMDEIPVTDPELLVLLEREMVQSQRSSAAIEPAEMPVIEAVAEESYVEITPEDTITLAIEEAVEEAVMEPAYLVGVDLSYGPDHVVVATGTRNDDGTVTIDNLEIDPPADRFDANGWPKASGFVKTGTPQPVREIPADEAVETFNDSEDDGVSKEDIIESIESIDEDEVFSAEPAENTRPNLRTNISAPVPTLESGIIDDELDILTSRPAPRKDLPVPVETQEPKDTPAPPKRKPLVFAYDDDII